MASGWKHFTGQSQYPELTSNKVGSSFTYGSKQDRTFRMGWLQGRRNVVEESEMLEWIERVTGQRLPRSADEVLEAIQDGKTLCRFLLGLNGSSLNAPINEKPALFSANDNICNFRDSLRNFGLSDVDLFLPQDILEKRDLAGLVATLKMLQQKISGH